MMVKHGYNAVCRAMMTALFCILITGQYTVAQPATATKLSTEDSIRLEGYLRIVFDVPVYSVKRQVYLDSALSITPKNAYLWQQKAMPLFKMHKYEIGQPYLDSAVKYNPKKWLDYSGFMKCIFSKNYRSAIADFEAARALNGNAGVMDHPYDFYEGLSYLQLNMFDSCIYYIDKCIQYKTKANGSEWVHPLHWFYEGIAWYEKEDYTQAIRCFDSSLSLYKNFADVQYYKALCLSRSGREEESLVLMKEGRENMRKGYTLTEDSIIYELYPYQVTTKKFDSYIAYAEREAKEKK